MNPRNLLVCVLAAGLLLAIHGLALADAPSDTRGSGGPPPEVVAMLREGGWQQVTREIFQRPVEGSIGNETIAFGADGLSWLLRTLEAELQSLEALRRDEYSPELEKAIGAHQALMQRIQDTVDEALKGPIGRKLTGWNKTACDLTVHRLAESSPGTLGPEARGEASFTETCGDYGETSVITYAQGLLGGVFESRARICNKDTDPNAAGYGSGTCAATIDDFAATSQCLSRASATVQINYDPPVVWSVSSGDNPYCIVLSAVNITGTSSLYVPPYSCRTASWSATTTGGTAPLTYGWRYNGSQVGTNSSSYSRTYCNNGCSCNGFSFTDTVSIVVNDTAGDTVNDSHNVTVTYGGQCGVVANPQENLKQAQCQVCRCPIPY